MSAGENTTKTRRRGAGRAAIGLAAVLLCGRAAAQMPSPDAMADRSAMAGALQDEELANTLRPGAAVVQPAMAEGESESSADALVPAIVFAPGSARLTPSATRILDDLGASLAAPELSTDRFRVEAHADGHGAPDTNRDLANRRAQAVVAYLEQNCGIAPDRLQVLASARPLGRGARRVRIVNLGP